MAGGSVVGGRVAVLWPQDGQYYKVPLHCWLITAGLRMDCGELLRRPSCWAT